ncbi:MAG TPA: Mrp/NBP35 family ATP-binding protein [Polyangiaceae bacterium]
MPLTVEAVHEALSKVLDPELGKPVTELGMISDVSVDGTEVRFGVDVGTSGTAKRDTLGAAFRQAIAAIGAKSVEIEWSGEIAGRPAASVPAASPNDPIPGVKNVILVMSGKGGVGKSTCATNLTLALKRAGHKVGLLDADIYGPSIPTMLGVMGRPVSADGQTIEPLERFGVKLMSIGFLLEDPKAAVIWRGPMLTGALNQFLTQVAWAPLDYLLLDLPPGTGDVALSISQRIKVTGAVVVTTPQPVATDDVFKSVSMCQKVNIPILGVVENMSFFLDSAGVRHELFGKGGGQAVADFAKAPLLGQVPIDQIVREWGDKGTPVVQASPTSTVAQAFVGIAEQLAEVVAARHEEAGPLIDRSGGQGRKRLPVTR